MFKDFFNNIRYWLKGSGSRTQAQADFEWEDNGYNIANDNFDSSDLLDTGSKTRSSVFLIAYIVIGLVFIVIWGRLWSLQVVQGDYNRQLAEENRVRTKTTAAPRGLIYDRNHKVLASNQPGYALIVYPADLPDEKAEQNKILKVLKGQVNIKNKLWRSITDTDLFQLDPVILSDNLTQEKALILKEKTADIKSVTVENQIRRKYDSSASLGHLLGYIGKISEYEYDQLGYSDLSYADYVGKSGLEKTYDQELRGTKSRKQIEVDSVGRVKRVLAEKDAQVGNSLELSIDYGLQRQLTASIRRMLGSKGLHKGVAVASDPRTGEILAMVSMPDYDDNIFSSPNVSKEYSKLLNDNDQPLFNRAISGLYPSGSVIKPIVAAAALQEKVVTANTWIDCKGKILVENRYNPDIVYRFIDNATHGPTNVIKALAKSCNVFFYHIGGGFDHIKGLGYEKLASYFSKFGLGQKTNIDLPLEEDGLIPSPEWKESTKGEVWYQGDTYHLSIGQGDLLVSPLQVNNYISAIVNHGNLLQPYLVREVISAKGRTIKKNKRKIIQKNIVSKGVANTVKQGMRAAVQDGTATPLQALSVSAGAKTGTAQNSKGEGKEHAWFTAFAPYDNPQIVITIVIENGGEGYDSALPIALEGLQHYFRTKK